MFHKEWEFIDSGPALGSGPFKIQLFRRRTLPPASVYSLNNAKETFLLLFPRLFDSMVLFFCEPFARRCYSITFKLYSRVFV
jgi:hypothetical protein